MRRFVILGMLCTATASAVADAPFALNTNTPDYVVTMIERVGAKQKFRSVMHHGDWTRVDTTEGVYKTTTHFSRSGSLKISGPSNGVDDGMHIEVSLHPKEIGWDTEPRNTGERETFLGESCTVWNAQRVNRPGENPKLEKLSCLTDDGIELWYRFVGSYGIISSGEATGIERLSVAVDEVQPPQNLLTLGWWDNDEPKSLSENPDFETVLEVRDEMRDIALDGGKQIIRTIRHHYPWTYDEIKASGTLRRLTISHASGRMRLSFVGPGGDAERLLTIWRRPSAEQPVSEIKPEDMNRSETILGEQCRWFELMPEMADAGVAECRTHDSIALKQSEWGRMSRTLSTAVSLARRPLALDDVKPPKEMLSLDWWTKENHSQVR